MPHLDAMVWRQALAPELWCGLPREIGKKQRAANMKLERYATPNEYYFFVIFRHSTALAADIFFDELMFFYDFVNARMHSV